MDETTNVQIIILKNDEVLISAIEEVEQLRLVIPIANLLLPIKF